MTATAEKPAEQKRIRVRPIDWPPRPKIVKSRQLVGSVPMTIRRRWQSLCGRYAVEHVLWWHPDMPSEWRTYGPTWSSDGTFLLWLHSEHRTKAAAFEAIAKEHRRLHLAECE